MTDLFTYLVMDYIERQRGGGADRREADDAAQRMEFFLHANDPDEHQLTGLLRAYASVEVDELDSLAPAVHEWFLENYVLLADRARESETLRSWFTNQPDLAIRFEKVFSLTNHDVIQYLCVNALLARDAVVDRGNGTALSTFLAQLTERRDLPGLTRLADILLELHFFSDHSRRGSEDTYALRRALNNLTGFDENELGAELRRRIRDRLDLIDPERQGEL